MESIEGSLLLMMEPICNPIFVVVILGEKMGTLAFIGSVIVIVGIALYTLVPALVAKKQAKDSPKDSQQEGGSH